MGESQESWNLEGSTWDSGQHMAGHQGLVALVALVALQGLVRWVEGLLIPWQTDDQGGPWLHELPISNIN